MQALHALLDRSVIIALAVAGAILATVASWLVRKPHLVGPRLARGLLRLGYAVSWASVAAFIVAGFLSGR